MNWRPLVISLPLVLCVSQVLKPVTYAEAAAMDASEAATLLAKSQAIDVKCGVLAKNLSQALRNFVAQAEISLAEKASVATARKAIIGGRAAGKTAVCDDAAKKLVNDVLAAATAATVAPIEDTTTITTPAVAVVEPVVTPEPAPVALAVATPAPKKPARNACPNPPLNASAGWWWPEFMRVPNMDDVVQFSYQSHRTGAIKSEGFADTSGPKCATLSMIAGRDKPWNAGNSCRQQQSEVRQQP